MGLTARYMTFRKFDKFGRVTESPNRRPLSWVGSPVNSLELVASLMQTVSQLRSQTDRATHDRHFREIKKNKVISHNIETLYL